jgi:hypothetical protein
VSWQSQQYEQHYINLNLERKGLFRLIRSKYGDKKIIYPGSSIHITPSFFFSDVTYLDRSDIAAKFFAQKDAVTELVRREQVYKSECRFTFIKQDFNEVVHLANKFDLLISLFAGRLMEKFIPFLKPGGHILTSGTFSDKNYADEMNLIPCDRIMVKNDQYYFVENSIQAEHMSSSRMKGRNEGIKFADGEMYYLYFRSGAR